MTFKQRFFDWVITDCRGHAIITWKGWMHEDHSSHSYRWLGLDLIPPTHILITRSGTEGEGFVFCLFSTGPMGSMRRLRTSS